MLACGALLGFALHAGAAPPSVGRVEDGLQELMDAGQALRRAAVWDGSLLEPETWLRRYEEALFQLMIGQAEDAAVGFGVLEASLSPEHPLAQDVGWSLSQALDQAGYPEAALRRYDAILADPSNPFRAPAREGQVLLLARLGRLDEVLGAVDQEPQPPDDLRYAAGRAAWLAGRADAAPRLEAALDGRHRARAAYHLGAIAVGRQDLEGAARWMTLAREASEAGSPTWELASLALARIANDQGRIEEALALYLTLTGEGPRSIQAQEERAWLLAAEGRVVEARQAAEAALALDPDGEGALALSLLRAQILHRVGESSAADEAYRQMDAELALASEALDGLAQDPLQGARALAGNLPGLATWAIPSLESSPDLQRAARLAFGLDQLDRNLEVGAEQIAQLEAALARPQAASARLSRLRSAAMSALQAAVAQELDLVLLKAERLEAAERRPLVEQVRSLREEFEGLGDEASEDDLRALISQLEQLPHRGGGGRVAERLDRLTFGVDQVQQKLDEVLDLLSGQRQQTQQALVDQLVLVRTDLRQQREELPSLQAEVLRYLPDLLQAGLDDQRRELLPFALAAASGQADLAWEAWVAAQQAHQELKLAQAVRTEAHRQRWANIRAHQP